MATTSQKATSSCCDSTEIGKSSIVSDPNSSAIGDRVSDERSSNLIRNVEVLPESQTAGAAVIAKGHFSIFLEFSLSANG